MNDVVKPTPEQCANAVRYIRGWRQLAELERSFAGLGPRPIPDLDAVVAWLDAEGRKS